MDGDQTTKKVKQPWPTKDAMEQIYEKKLWGGKNFDFYSGDGSHDIKIIEPYLNAVTIFLKSFEKPIRVCDLGCGDFNIGKHLVPHTDTYIAIDIVEDLVERNKQKHNDVKLEFKCLDIAIDDLPQGDCALVRQVLQHLSNTEVKKVVAKLANFKYIILTEHLPKGEFEPNKDIISGQGIRIKKQSGLNLLAPPFNFHIKNEKQLLSFTLEQDNGTIVTTLYTVF